MNVTLKRFAWLEMDHPLGIWHFFLLSKLFYFHVRRRKPLFRQGWHWWFDIKKLFLLNQVWKFNFLAGNFEIVKTYLFTCQAKKANIPARFTLTIWHKNETYFSMIFSFFFAKSHFWREITKSSNYFVFPCRSKKAITNEGGLMIWQLT